MALRIRPRSDGSSPDRNPGWPSTELPDPASTGSNIPQSEPVSVPILPAELMGLRVVRALAHDERADVLLVRSAGGRALVVKLFHAEVARAAIDRELVALSRVRHPHVIGLVDAETTEARVAAVLPRLSNGTVSRWLETRDRIEVGEAVTLLAPLADAVSVMHDSGVAHGRLTTGRVLFDDSMAPVVIGLGTAALFPPASPPVALERMPEVAADLEALRTLAEEVLARVRGSAARPALALRDRVAAAPLFELGRVLVDGLFAMAAGSPIRLEPPVSGEPTQDGIRRVPTPDGIRRVPTPESPKAVGALALSSLAREGLRATLDRGPTSTLRDGFTAMWARLDSARRRAAVGALAAVLTVALAVLLIPSAPTSVPAAARVGSTAVPTPPPTPPRTMSASPRSVGPSVLRGADPLAALPVLLSTRERCLRDQDASCLAAVEEAGSPAAAMDARTIAGGASAVAAVLSTDGARTVQRLGDAVLVEAGIPPIRLLLVRVAQRGWRIRDLSFAPPS